MRWADARSAALICPSTFVTARRWEPADLSLDHDLVGIGSLLKGQVEARLDLFADTAAVVLGIVRDADDGNRLVDANPDRRS